MLGWYVTATYFLEPSFCCEILHTFVGVVVAVVIRWWKVAHTHLHLGHTWDDMAEIEQTDWEIFMCGFWYPAHDIPVGGTGRTGVVCLGRGSSMRDGIHIHASWVALHYRGFQ